MSKNILVLLLSFSSSVFATTMTYFPDNSLCYLKAEKPVCTGKQSGSGESDLASCTQHVTVELQDGATINVRLEAHNQEALSFDFIPNPFSGNSAMKGAKKYLKSQLSKLPKCSTDNRGPSSIDSSGRNQQKDPTPVRKNTQTSGARQI